MRLRSLRQFLGTSVQIELLSLFPDLKFIHFRPDSLKVIKNSKGEWFFVVFSHPDVCIPNTFMFSLVRNKGNRLDAPCG